MAYKRNKSLSSLLRGRLDLLQPFGEGERPARLEEAFMKRDWDAYSFEVRAFFSYALAEVVLGEFLNIRPEQIGNVHRIVAGGGYHSRVNEIFRPPDARECRFCCICRSGRCLCGTQPAVQGDRSVSVGAEMELLRLIADELPVKADWSLDTSRLGETTRSCLKKLLARCPEAAASTPVAKLIQSDPDPESELRDLLKRLDLDEDEQAACFEAIGLLLGFGAQSIPLFGYGAGLSPQVKSALLQNRRWLENAEFTLRRLVAMAMELCSLEESAAIHYFYFNLGYEKKSAPDGDGAFSASGHLLLVEKNTARLDDEELAGVQRLMQEAMSSMAIFEHGLIRAHFEGELQRTETTRRILRKMHHSLSGPISMAFNRFAMRKERLLRLCDYEEKIRSQESRQALAEIDSTLRNLKSQTVSWVAFSNPERFGDRKLLSELDLSDVMKTLLHILSEESGKKLDSYDVPSGMTLCAVMDVGLVEVALWQMVKNACDHLKSLPGARIKKDDLIFGFEEKDGWQVFWIENGGQAVSPERLATLHQSIRQRQTAPSSKPNGQGFGLLTCSEIADYHGGDFAVTACDGRFRSTLRLPKGTV